MFYLFLLKILYHHNYCDICDDAQPVQYRVQHRRYMGRIYFHFCSPSKRTNLDKSLEERHPIELTMEGVGGGKRRGDDGAEAAPRWRFSRPSSQGGPWRPPASRASARWSTASTPPSTPPPPAGARPAARQRRPTASACYRTAPAAEDAVVDALRSGAHNGYSLTVGVLSARR